MSERENSIYLFIFVLGVMEKRKSPCNKTRDSSEKCTKQEKQPQLQLSPGDIFSIFPNFLMFLFNNKNAGGKDSAAV